MSAEGTEIYFARLLEACATGASVQESIAAVAGIEIDSDARGMAKLPPLTPETAQRLSDAASAANDVAAEFIEQGIDPEDADPSWSRLRRMSLGLRHDAPLGGEA